MSRYSSLEKSKRKPRSSLIPPLSKLLSFALNSSSIPFQFHPGFFATSIPVFTTPPDCRWKIGFISNRRISTDGQRTWGTFSSVSLPGGSASTPDFALCGHFMPPIANDTGTLSSPRHRSGILFRSQNNESGFNLRFQEGRGTAFPSLGSTSWRHVLIIVF